jgi:hypothetical protein
MGKWLENRLSQNASNRMRKIGQHCFSSAPSNIRKLLPTRRDLTCLDLRAARLGHALPQTRPAVQGGVELSPVRCLLV